MRIIDRFGRDLSKEQVLEELKLPFPDGEAVERLVNNLPFAANPARTFERAESWAIKQWLLHISNPRRHVRRADKSRFIQQRISDWYLRSGI